MRDDERRLKIVFVPERELLHLFQPIGQCVALRLDHPRLPADAKVVRVHHQYDRMALAVVVHSASFPVCPEGQQLEFFETGDWSPRFEARYVVGDRLTPFKPMELELQEQAERQAINNAIGPLYISSDLKAKMEACTEIVDHKPLSDSADAARRALTLHAGDTIQTSMGPGKVLASNVTIRSSDRVINTSISVPTTLGIGSGPPYPIPAELLEGQMSMSGDKDAESGDKDAEAEFFRKSIMAE